MKIRTIGPFRWKAEGGEHAILPTYPAWNYRRFSLCAGEMDEVFGSLDEAKPLQVEIHNRPAKKRAKVLADEYGNARVVESDDFKWFVTLPQPVKSYVLRNLPKTFYVEVVQ